MVQDVEELKGTRKRRLKDVRTCCSLLIVFVFPALSLLLPPCVSALRKVASEAHLDACHQWWSFGP